MTGLQADDKPPRFLAALLPRDLSSSIAEYLKQRGNRHFAAGRLDGALRLYRRAVLIKPDFAEALNNIGFVQLQVGNIEEAILSFSRAIALDRTLLIAHRNLGNAYQRQGDLDKAAACFHELVSVAPDNADAHYAYGNILCEQSKHDEAMASLRQAVSLDPRHFLAHNALGLVRHRQGQAEEAAEHFENAIAANADFFIAHFNLGLARRALGQNSEAMACQRRAIALNPRLAEAHFELGRLCLDNGDLDLAKEHYQKAISSQADFADAHGDLGMVYLKEGKLVEAAYCFEEAARIAPDVARYHANLGLVLFRQDKPEASIASLDRALELEPNLLAAHCNRAAALQFLGRPEEAVAAADKAIGGDPSFADALIAKGTALQALSRFVEAEACFQRVLELEPDETTQLKMKANIAMAHLARGLFASGWREYKNRFHPESPTFMREFPQPHWAGEPLEGKSLLIWGEQGIGDELMFASMFSEVIARTRRCVVECHEKLVPLLTRSLPGALVVARTTPPHPATLEGIDFQSAAAELAQWVRPTLESFPRHGGFLVADPARVAYWRGRLAELGPGLKVGICWRSRLQHGLRRTHYTSLNQWGPIFGIPGVDFINLQYDDCAAELAEARKQFGVPVHAYEEVDLFNDIDESAALAKALDLVITAPTTTGSISAGQGVLTWELSFGRSWVSLGTDHYPWLPSVRLYQRFSGQEWEEIIAAVAGDLSALAPSENKNAA